MKITPTPFDIGRLPGFSAEHNAKRSVGLHQGEIIAYTMFRGGYSDKYRPGEWDASGMLKAQLGFLWEDVLEKALKDMFLNGHTPMRQIELKHEGIYQTVDCVVLDSDPPRIEEYKLTKKSLRKFKEDMPRHFFNWVLQTAGYCHGASAAFGVPIRHARLVPIFLNGDYSWKPPHGDTTIWPVDIEYSAAELEEYWSIIKTNGEALEREKAAGTWPPKRGE